jgi:hypothetical protein
MRSRSTAEVGVGLRAEEKDKRTEEEGMYRSNRREE